MNAKNPRYQSGASILLIILMIGLGAGIFSVGMKLYPSYTDHKVIVGILNEVLLNKDMVVQSNRSIRTTINRRLTINSIYKFRGKDKEDWLTISRDKGFIFFKVKYQDQVPIYYNVDALVKFDESLQAKLP
ncbi:DUF4845 domain-containing protein [Pontibacter sp. JAM-7]|uniref:DUF4845 domain-containing protein n=1 Tax=Pontibacter sp. JAM-7 TaxID=3366581 RepID=UPI003AF730E0